MADLQQILVALYSTDNVRRGQAEQLYNQTVKQNPSSVAVGLLSLIKSCPDEATRAIAAVLLRRIMDPMQPHTSKIDAGTQVGIRKEILSIIETGTHPQTIRKVCHAAGAITKGITEAPWPDLLPFVVNQAQQQEVIRRESGFFLLSQVAEYNGEILVAHANNLQPILLAGIQDIANGGVTKAAIKSAVSLISLMPEVQKGGLMQSLMPALLGALGAFAGTDELLAREVMQELCQLIVQVGKNVGPVLPSLVPAMLQLGRATTLDEGTRSTAMEVLLTVCEKATAVVKGSDLPKELLTIELEMLCEVEANESEWVAAPYENQDKMHADEADEIASCGEDAVFRTILAIGTPLLAPALALVQQWSAQGDWRGKRASLVVLQALAVGCTKGLKKQLRGIMPVVIACLADVQQRVRYAAVECVAIFSDEYPTVFQRMYANSALPAIIAVLGDSSSCDKVKGHAAAAMCNFANPNSCNAVSVEPHLDGLLSNLCQLLTTGSSVASQEQALVAVANIAEVAEADFGKYYDSFMPGAKSLVATATGKEQVDLRGKAMEAISMMGEAVGVEKFLHDGKEVLETIIRLRKATGAGSENLDSYAASACARTCTVLGEASAPYLKYLIPPLIETIKREVEFSFNDAEDAETPGDAAQDENGLVKTTVHVRGLGMQKVSLNVAALQDKQDACRTLFEYADKLPSLFAEYVEPATNACVPLITDKISHDVRGTAAMLFPKILAVSSEYLREKGQDYALGMLTVGIKQIFTAIDKETNNDTRLMQSEALNDAMKVCHESGGKNEAKGDGSFAPPVLVPPLELTSQFVGKLIGLMQQSIAERGAVQQLLAAGDMDEEQFGEALEAEEDFTTNLVDAHGFALKTLRENFVSILDAATVPFFRPLLAVGNHDALRINAVCVFDDAIEFCGAHAHKYLNLLLPVIMECMTSDNATLRQCSVYGIAKAAEFAPEHFRPHVTQAVNGLVKVINAPNAREDWDDESATENAISAIGKICLFHGTSVDLDTLLPMWLGCLPLTADTIEAKVMHAQLLNYIEGGEPRITAAANLAALMRAVGGVLAGGADENEEEAQELVEENIRPKFGAVLQKLLGQTPPAQMQAAFQGLTPLQQQAIQLAVQQ